MLVENFLEKGLVAEHPKAGTAKPQPESPLLFQFFDPRYS
jgi:hypothetical protein